MTDPLKFDLIAALEGRTYPKKEVPIFLDEQLMFDYVQLCKDADYDPHNKEKADLRDLALAQFKDAAITVTVVGIPTHVVESVRAEVDAEYPPEHNAFGGLKANPAADEEFTLRMWHKHIPQMAVSNGAVLNPTLEDLKAFRLQAPLAAKLALQNAINELTENTLKSYEMIVQDPDFLSQPSQTE